jgi:hypothetical protein
MTEQKPVRSKIIMILISFFLGGLVSSCGEKIKNSEPAVKEEVKVEICKCLTEPKNSEWMKKNNIQCRDLISKEIGVADYEKVNMALYPEISAKFDAIAEKCTGKKKPLLKFHSFSYLDILDYDLNTKLIGKDPYTLYDAMKACEKLGAGWRLPEMHELRQLYLKKSEIFQDSNTSFKSEWYWSGTRFNNQTVENFVTYYGMHMEDGREDNMWQPAWNYGFPAQLSVRPVRNRNIGILKIGKLQCDFSHILIQTKFSEAQELLNSIKDGWRIPTMSELEVISNYCKSTFAAPLGWYWSCDYRENDDRYIQTYNFEHGVSDFVPPRESMGVEPYRLNAIFVKDN